MKDLQDHLHKLRGRRGAWRLYPSFRELGEDYVASGSGGPGAIVSRENGIASWSILCVEFWQEFFYRREGSIRLRIGQRGLGRGDPLLHEANSAQHGLAGGVEERI